MADLKTSGLYFKFMLKSKRDWIILVIIGLLGTTASFLSYDMAKKREIAIDKMNFENASQRRISLFSFVSGDYLSHLETLQYFHQASEKVTRDEFRDFVSGILKQNPGIQALEWIPRVSSEVRSRYVDEARQEGLKDFEITGIDSHGNVVKRSEHSEYFPVYYLEPLAGNEAALGFDLASNPARLEALNRSRDTGFLIASEQIRLVQEKGNQSGFLVFIPVYTRGSTSNLIEERRKNLEGFFLAVFTTRDFLDHVFAKQKAEGIDVYVYDNLESDSQLIYYYSARSHAGAITAEFQKKSDVMSGLHSEVTLDILGRSWTLICVPARGSKQWTRTTWYPVTILTIGLLFTGLIVTYLSSLQLDKARSEQLSDFQKSSNLKLEEERAALDSALTSLQENEKAQKLLVTAIEQAAESIVITDVHGAIQYVNPAFEKMTGYSMIEMIGQNPRILKSGEHDENFYRDLWSTISRGEVWTGALTNRNKKNELIFQESTISPVKDTSGKIVNYVAVNRDVTREQLLRSQLDQSQKMEAIGTLAGGIAHDFNNIIYAITGYTELALMKSLGDSKMQSYLNKILKSAERAGEMVSQILSFSRKGPQEKKNIDIRPVIKEALKFLRGAIPTTIEIQQSIDSDVPPIHGDSTQVYQILMNLCTNAVSSIGDRKGALTVSLSSVQLDEDFCRSHSTLSAGKHVRLTLKDTGDGIPPEIMGRIFEPYFTTKNVGEGTGLGLSVIYGIVQSHGGAITVESEQGKGATFNIFFPAIEKETVSEEEPEIYDNVTSQKNILWIDDEQILIPMYKAILENIGFKVVTTTDPLKGLEMLRKAPESFDLVITDLTMPEMTGIELAKNVHSLRSDIPIIICTGFNNFKGESDLISFGVRKVLYKPTSKAELSRAIFEILGDETDPRIFKATLSIRKA